MHAPNIWAILAAAVSAFILGGLWYSPALFLEAWKRANGFGKDQPPPGSPTKTFGISFVFSLVMAANLAMFLNAPDTTARWGATAGFLAGFGWATMGMGIVALFERRPWLYVAINGGYLTVALTLMGAILGAVLRAYPICLMICVRLTPSAQGDLRGWVFESATVIDRALAQIVEAKCIRPRTTL